MAKLKAARGKGKSKTASWTRGIPCLIVIVSGLLLMMLLLSSILSSPK